MKLLLPIEFFPPHQQSFFRIYPTDGITRRNRRGLAWQGGFCSSSKKKIWIFLSCPRFWHLSIRSPQFNESRSEISIQEIELFYLLIVLIKLIQYPGISHRIAARVSCGGSPWHHHIHWVGGKSPIIQLWFTINYPHGIAKTCQFIPRSVLLHSIMRCMLLVALTPVNQNHIDVSSGRKWKRFAKLLL